MYNSVVSVLRRAGYVPELPRVAKGHSFQRKGGSMPIESLYPLFLICTAMFVASWVLHDLHERWSRLPHFVSNYVGGVLAICSVSDFKRAFAEGSLVKREGEEPLVRVMGTIVFSNAHIGDSDKKHILGGIWADRRGVVHPKVDGCFMDARREPRLFVPFSSERYLTFQEQNRMFICSVDPHGFAETRILENKRNDCRLRFVDRVGSEPFKVLLAVTGLTTFAVMLFLAVTWFNKFEERSANRETVIHITSPSSSEAQELRMTIREADRFLIGNVLAFQKEIYRGPVVEIQNLGGGASWSCIHTGSYKRCGYSAAKLEVGSVGYLRFANLLHRVQTERWIDSLRGANWWFITKGEAEALNKVGYEFMD